MNRKQKSILAWHFVGETLRDGRPVPADGEKLIFPGRPVLCEQGLHASRDPFDALRYAPGAVLCRVRCGGTIVESGDKLVCTERTILARADATEALRYFARMQALSVIHLYPGEPADAVLDWLMTGDEAARSAARSAESAAESAESAAESARSAAESAAESAAWSAAMAAESAESAAESAESAAREEWNALVREAF